jgi:hypothetical protein
MPDFPAATHTALFRASMRRRLLEITAHDVYRQARPASGMSPYPRQFDAAQRRMDEAATSLGKQIDA